MANRIHRQIGRPRERCHRRDFKAWMATGINARKRLKIHVHIESKTVIAAAPAYLQSQRGYFPSVYIDAGGARIRSGSYLKIPQQPYDRLLKIRYQSSDVFPSTTQIEEHIDHPLPGPVIGYLTAAINLDNGNIPGR